MRVVSFLFFLFFSSLTLTVRAAPADAGLAEALFTSGKEAMARGDLASACARLSESLKLDPAVGTLLNLATCEERSGKLVSALDRFKTARQQLAKDDFRVPFVTERITTLGRRIPHLVVRVAEPFGPGARVLRDGAELQPGSFGTPIPVDPGAHVIVVESAGRPARRTELALREGEEKVIELHEDVRPVTAPPKPTNDEAPTTTGETRRTLAFVTGGLALGALVTGTVTGIMAVNAADTYRAHCVNGECDPEGLSAASTGRTVRLVSPIAFVAGGVLAIASAYLFLSAPKPARRSTHLVPTALPAGGGIVLTHTF